MHDRVATNHRQPAVPAIETHVLHAVGIALHAARHEMVFGGKSDGTPRRRVGLHIEHDLVGSRLKAVNTAGFLCCMT